MQRIDDTPRPARTQARVKTNAEMTVPEIVLALHTMSTMTPLEVALSARLIDDALRHLHGNAQARVVAFWLMQRLQISGEALNVAYASMEPASNAPSELDADALRDLGIGGDHA